MAAIIERDGRYLLVEEHTSVGLRLNNPAGHLEPGESLVSAVIREVLEETACAFTPEALVGVYLSRSEHPRTGEDITRICKDDQPFSAFVYKTIADPFVGKLSLFRIFSGMLSGQTTLYNPGKDKTEKCGGIYILRGKKQVVKESLHAGDIAFNADLVQPARAAADDAGLTHWLPSTIVPACKSMSPGWR